jgi:heterodisulfide reductase subunit A
MNLSNSKVLILGGGIAGLTAALALNRLGVSVELIEKSETLGGMVRNFCCKASPVCQQCGACLVNDALKMLAGAHNVDVHLQAELKEIKMDAKEFLYTYSRPEGGGEGRAAALLLATGFTPFRAEDKPQYRYGILPNVLTGLDLEKQLRETGKVIKPSDQTAPQSMAFIQCVGSRDLHLNHPFCSQVCCGYALRMANLIKHKSPQMEITVFYMDIQSFGKDFSAFLTQTRKQIRFIRSIPGEISAGDQDQVIFTFQSDDGLTSQKLAADLAVLSVGMMPGLDNPVLSQMLGHPLNADGFLPANPEASRPVGIFSAGAVSGPKSISRSIAQAYQAVEEVAAFLSKRSSV